MNSTELRKKLIHLTKQPLEKLSSQDLKKIDRQLELIFESLEKVEIISKTEELIQNVSLENKPFTEYLLSKFKMKKPTQTSTKAQWEKYYKNLKLYLESTRQKRNELQKVLEKLIKVKETEGVKIIQGLKDEEKKLLSLLASLTQKKAKGVKSLNIGQSKESILIWLNELKNVRRLGVLEEHEL